MWRTPAVTGRRGVSEGEAGGQGRGAFEVEGTTQGDVANAVSPGYVHGGGGKKSGAGQWGVSPLAPARLAPSPPARRCAAPPPFHAIPLPALAPTCRSHCGFQSLS